MERRYVVQWKEDNLGIETGLGWSQSIEMGSSGRLAGRGKGGARVNLITGLTLQKFTGAP